MASLPEAGSRVSLSWDVDGVAIVTMSGAPPNPSSFEAIEHLADRLQEARESGARVVVVASDVEGYWLGHASLGDLARLFRGEPTTGSGAGFFRAADELAKQEVVSIAAISGDCAGGGAELGWACDLRVAVDSARFAQLEVLIGLTTGLGGISRLMRLIGRSAASEIALDGAPLLATRLYQLGAINRLVEHGRAQAAAVAWARRLASRPAAALRATKRILFESDELPLAEALANEQRHFQRVARSAEALALMDEVQAEYDAGVVHPARAAIEPFDP